MVSSTWTIISVAALFVVLLLLERAFPLRQHTHSLLRRLLLNLAISALTFGTAFLVVQPAASFMLSISDERAIGLLQWLELPLRVQIVVVFLLMDLTFYYWHLANHKIPFLWRFHNIHHIDPDLDVSTGFRFHVVETALSAGFRVGQVALIGLPAWMFGLYELVFQANTLFHHSNVRLPISLERSLNWFLVTPRMHGIHHSRAQSETNSNYSVVFPWWDWLHRSIRLNIHQRDILIGVPAYSAPDDNTFWNALLIPFRKQRPYWRKADGGMHERDISPEWRKRMHLEE